jgi:hypothetical protein
MNLPQVNGFAASVATPLAPERTIPFDYAFRFDLEGKPGKVQNTSLEVSVEAAFTAVSIGYGVVPKANPITFGLPVATPASGPVSLAASSRSLFSATLVDLLKTLSTALDEELEFSRGKIGSKTAAVLSDGLRFNPEFSERIFLTGGTNLDARILREAFQAVGAPVERIAFKYELFDQGSGREFQSEPILNIAGLGSPDGKRPFRYYARPIEFAPRSIIRMQITEVSAFQGELHVSLQGYKTLGQAGTPTGSRSQRHRRIRR